MQGAPELSRSQFRLLRQPLPAEVGEEDLEGGDTTGGRAEGGEGLEEGEVIEGHEEHDDIKDALGGINNGKEGDDDRQ